MSSVHYLDHNATAPLLPEAMEVMIQAARLGWGNPSSIHSPGRDARKWIEDARESLAALVGSQPLELVFTSGGSESCNLGIIGAARSSRSKGRHLVVSEMEHSAVRAAALFLQEEGWEVTWVRPNSEGWINPQSIAEAIRPDTTLCAVMAANNEIGSIQPIQAIGSLLRKRKVWFFCDAVQALGKIPVDVSTWPVDIAAFASHKIGGPKGVGALYVHKGVTLEPFVRGGSQERGLRGGTENVPGIAGFGAAAKVWRERGVEERLRLEHLRDELEKALIARIPECKVNGAGVSRVPNTLNVSFPEARGDIMVMALSLNDVAVSAGSACASGSVKPSAVLMAMGRTQKEATSSLRFSLGWENTLAEISEVVQATADAFRNSLGANL